MSIATDQVKFLILCIEHGCAKIDFNKVAAEYTRLSGQDLTANAASKRLSRLKIKIAEAGGTETSPKKTDMSPMKKGASPKKKVKEEVKEDLNETVNEKVKEEVKMAPPSPKKRRLDRSAKSTPSPTKVKRELDLEEIEKVMLEVNMKDDQFFENDPFWVS